MTLCFFSYLGSRVHASRSAGDWSELIAITLAASAASSYPHARRRSIGRSTLLTKVPYPASSLVEEQKHAGSNSGPRSLSSPRPNPTVQDTSSGPHSMSLSRTPSPRPGGGWSTPGLKDGSGYSTPRWRDYDDLNSSASDGIAWAAAKAKSNKVRGTPSFTTRNEGFFSRQRRKISATLPRFNSFNSNQKDWNTEKLGRGRWRPAGGGKWSRLRTLAGNILRKFKFLIVVFVLMILMTLLWTKSSECFHKVAMESLVADEICRHDRTL